ncbi:MULTISPECIES: multidrug effflux MFS transporter [Photorhabdus]|uniref:Bcr/CflA family efflux transporter n=2 Tax=Photorhabdus TaxID=29487 RepID=A0A329X204_9GAMM|nr:MULTISPECIES: multidrug effflux MFS transporter [Photorhabdus]NDL00064.1 Bcr/CflA family efflux MFS transporter [Photorhabdus bodei]NDL04199.1 Bcr/CflA family efflux MFS transporter [Photorhabdus bodei]NDL08363.1 Bcr/CflA family efflux MFS transporter [Photorhabdus bodei]RAW90684.1 Bcr/CflA family drug resistance efflux transporter [Photorhabdus laumondii subsp. clarkei]RAX09278.1 Bcr/CflA family drug resistance efflux transporter [Photorhabdus bodei]
MKNKSLLFVVLMAFLSMGGLVSSDIFLPALSKMGNYYHVSESSIQSTITIFLFGIAFSQLIYGPLSDCLGRKTVLISGMIIWLISTIGIFYSTHISELLLLRLFQGIGACAGITLSRAIISDLMEKEEAANLYLIIFPFVGMSPAIAPMIGGMLSEYYGWRSCFLFLTLFITVTLILCLLVLKESLPINKRQKLSIKNVLVSTYQVIINKEFLYYAAIPCFAYTAYFSYLIESPFILTAMGLPEKYVGYTYIMLSLSYVLGNLIAKKLSRRQGVRKTISHGYLIFVVGGIAFTIQMFFSSYPLITSVLTISVLTFGNGFLLPLGTASAIATHSQAAGTASGVMGTLQLGSAGLASLFIGYISHHEPIKVASIITVVSLVGSIIYITGNRGGKEISRKQTIETKIGMKNG